MKAWRGKLEIMAPFDAPRGAWLQIGTGEDADFTQVLASKGTTLKVGTVRWYHRAWWKLQELPGVTVRALRRGLCAMARHRVTRDALAEPDAPWRCGRTVGRTIYRQAGAGPSDDDVLIGMMDTPELAAEACAGHNAMLEARLA